MRLPTSWKRLTVAATAAAVAVTVPLANPAAWTHPAASGGSHLGLPHGRHTSQESAEDPVSDHAGHSRHSALAPLGALSLHALANLGHIPAAYAGDTVGGPWAFEETFDSYGAPSSPQPFTSPRMQVIVGSNNFDGIMDGQYLDSSGNPHDGPIEAGHGHDCGAPINRSPSGLNSHVVSVDRDLLGFQQNTRPHLAYVCNGHMMTA